MHAKLDVSSSIVISLVRARVRLPVYISFIFFFLHVYEIPLPRALRASRKLPFLFLLGSNFTATDGAVKPVGLCARQSLYLHLKRALWRGPRPRQSGELAI